MSIVNEGLIDKKSNKEQKTKKRIVNDEEYLALVENNYRLVWSVVNKFVFYNNDKDDLFQSGCIGLVIAAQKFDRERGTRFSTFAIPYIIGEIKSYLRSKNQIKISKKILSNQRKIKKMMNLDEGTHNKLSLTDIAKKLDISFEDVLLAQNFQSRLISLDKKVMNNNQTQATEYKDLVEDKQHTMNEERIEIKDYLNKLPSVQKNIVYLRYFYGFTQTEVAKKLTISQSKVSRIENKILKSFKSFYED